jgi:hypothetical protein
MYANIAIVAAYVTGVVSALLFYEGRRDQALAITIIGAGICGIMWTRI